ncbi:SusC/RagA family TonB-linked outer membrane protein [Mucilaginibacter paludis]|uniref:TonB-dependent receptor plug n=1 Tax=Mucilaginibacter paludis DSM 18603 TaxID=714943 RepID=H1YCZ0_9SPHI|nr:SusC/RagA family TonB-linked outer membrane protein [Mucilaginibacter paludis]EHQ25161.1 TonB-dependent receptor plug [Mucilaginibacter paludis DSM 18603]
MDENFYKKRKLKIKTFLLLLAIIYLYVPKVFAVPDQQAHTERLESVLKKMELQYHVNFVYDAAEINKNLDINIPPGAKTVDAALQQLGTYGIAYRVVGNKVILKKQVVADIIIRGKVVESSGPNSTGDVLIGVTILEKGTRNAVATGQNGDYQIKVKENAILVFSMIGYKTQEISVTGKTTIVVSLEPTANNMKEVVVTGYQDIKKKLFTGAATTLKAADAKRDGIADVSRMLEGRVAGVSVQNVSGTFGAAPKIRIRGATSITGENKPLWVVDGIILEDVVNISNEQLSTGDPSTLLGSAVAGINPDDIESFEILKDATATSLYGARAMNGVIIITTKKGRVGNPIVSYTGNYSSYLKPTYSTFDIMNSYDQMSVYSQLQREGFLNYSTVSRAENGGVYAKLAQGITNGTILNTPESRNTFLNRYAQANTNWFDILFKNSFMQEHSLSVSTGTEKSQTYYSTSYLKDNGWTVADKVQRFTANVNTNFNLSPKVSLGFITKGSIRDQQAPGTLGRTGNPVTGEYSRDFDINPFSYAINTSRTLTAYDENGNREYFTRNYAPFNILNELDNNTLNLTQVDLSIQTLFKYQIFKNLKYSFDGSYRYTKSSQEHKVRENSNMAEAYRADYDATVRENNRFLYRNPDDANAEPVVVLPQGGFYYTVDDYLVSYFFRNTLNFDKTFGKHKIGLFAAQQLQFANRQNRSFTGYGYQFDKGGVPFIDPNAIKQAVEGNFNYYSITNRYDRFAAFVADGTYSYNEKYNLKGTIRYDGSNLLGESSQARWLPTWNVSGSWNVDEEEFMKNQSVIDGLKLRVGYGLVASYGTATNSSLVLQSTSTKRPYLSEVETALYIAGLENSQLTWEKQYETNIGIDINLFKNRLSLSADIYNREGFDLIGQIRTSGVGGEALKVANYADLHTQGVEFTLGGTILKKKDFGFKSQLTFGLSKGKITNLKSEPNIFDLIGADGGPKEGYPTRGLFSIDFQKLQDYRENHGLAGVPIFINEKGIQSSSVYLQDPNTSFLTYEGPVDPLYTGGFYNTFTYKNFTLSALITFSGGNKVRLNPVYKNKYSDLDALPNEFLSRYVLPDDEKITFVPSIVDPRGVSQLDGTYPYNAYNYSSARVADGGFIRLKQVSLGYNVPTKYTTKLGLNNASLNVVTNNLWLIYSDSKLNGQDPEFFSSGGVALPIPRQFTVSLKVGF